MRKTIVCGRRMTRTDVGVLRAASETMGFGAGKNHGDRQELVSRSYVGKCETSFAAVRLTRTDG